MAMSARKIRAYHRQLEKIRALRQVDLLDAIRVAFHGDNSEFKDARNAMLNRGAGEPEPTITLATNEDIDALLRGALK